MICVPLLLIVLMEFHVLVAFVKELLLEELVKALEVVYMVLIAPPMVFVPKTFQTEEVVLIILVDVVSLLCVGSDRSVFQYFLFLLEEAVMEVVNAYQDLSVIP